MDEESPELGKRHRDFFFLGILKREFNSLSESATDPGYSRAELGRIQDLQEQNMVLALGKHINCHPTRYTITPHS